MFSSFGAKVTLVVSRQQVLPGKDPEVAAVLEDDFLRRGVKLLKGARADVDRTRRRRRRRALRRRPCRSARPHAVLAIGSIPNTEDLGLDAAGVEVDRAATSRINHHCQTNVAAHLRRRRRQRQAAAVVGGVDAGPQGRRARDGPAHARATATSTTTRRPRRSSPSPRSPTSAWPRPRRSLSVARSASPRCRSRPPPRR